MIYGMMNTLNPICLIHIKKVKQKKVQQKQFAILWEVIC